MFRNSLPLQCSPTSRECFTAQRATVARSVGGGNPEVVVGRSAANPHKVVLAADVGAARDGGWRQVARETGEFVGNGLVALDGEPLMEQQALQVRAAAPESL